MGSTTKRGYWFPAGDDTVSLFPGQNELLFMKKLDTDMDTALTAAIAAARIPNLAASKITSGTFAEARIPTIKKEKLDSLVWARVSEMIQNQGGGGGGGPVTSADITDATATGRAVLTAASTAAARSAIGAGTSSAATGSAAELNTGTATTGRSWSAKVIADYVDTHGGGGGGGGIGALVDVPRNEAVTTTTTDIKVAKDSNTGLCFLTGKITCSASFENGDIIATLPPGYFTPTSFDKPVFATPQPVMGDKDMSKADHVSFNTNNGEIRLSLSVFPEAGMWLGINCIFSENYVGITR